MVLVFDIGNTNITAGIFSGSRIVKSLRMRTSEAYTPSKYYSIVKSLLQADGLSSVNGCIIGSVVPSITGTLSQMVKRYLKIKPVLITSQTKLNIRNRYKNKAEVGDDRLANAAAGKKENPGRPLIIIDFGTTINFDVVNRKGEYLGGIIMPGLNLSKEILFKKAAKLPRVEMKLPGKIIGNTTVHSIQSGVVNSTIAGINYMIAGIKKELKSENPKIILTGGEVDKNILKRINSRDKRIDKDFTLKGFKIIYDLNSANRD